MKGADVHSVGFWSAVVVSMCFTVFGISLLHGFWADTMMLGSAASLIPAPAFVGAIRHGYSHLEQAIEGLFHCGFTGKYES